MRHQKGQDSTGNSLNSETFFVENFDAGTPVMVDWEDWRGHWQVAIGIDTCNTDDPYDDVLNHG